MVPLRQRNRLIKLNWGDSSFHNLEIEKCEKLKDNNIVLATQKQLLHKSVDGAALSKSSKVPSQHRWVTDGNKLLSVRDYMKCVKFRINAMPTRSRTTRGRKEDRSCRAGCNAPETLDHVLQNCHRSHRQRIERHNAICNYVKSALEKSHTRVDAEPTFKTPQGIRKPDLIAAQGQKAILLDAQVVGSSTDMAGAHRRKLEYYKNLENDVKLRYNVSTVAFNTITLNIRGVWHEESANFLVPERIVKKDESKVISTRVIIGGLIGFAKWSKTTTTRKERQWIG